MCTYYKFRFVVHNCNTNAIVASTTVFIQMYKLIAKIPCNASYVISNSNIVYLLSIKIVLSAITKNKKKIMDVMYILLLAILLLQMRVKKYIVVI